MKTSFLNHERPLIISMVQSKTPERTMQLMDLSRADGADGYGVQFEQLLPEYKNENILKDIFSHANGLPVYATNYRYGTNEGKTDNELASEILQLADCGATLCDIMGDLFDKTEGELTVNAEAVAKQKELIDKLHQKGTQVLMSSHVLKFTPAERVLEIALEQQKRGADICKIVTYADTTAQQMENLRIITLLKEKLDIPFLFLAGGECRILRRIGGELGNVMYLGVHEYDELATPAQPLIKNLRAIRDNMEN